MTIVKIRERTKSEWIKTVIDYYFMSEYYLMTHWDEHDSSEFRRKMFFNNEAWTIIKEEGKLIEQH